MTKRTTKMEEREKIEEVIFNLKSNKNLKIFFYKKFCFFIKF